MRTWNEYCQDQAEKDRWEYRCPKCKCSRSLRHNTGFGRWKLPFSTLLCIIWAWTNDHSIKNTCQFINGAHERSVVRIFKWLRKLVRQFQVENPTQLGGEDDIVEIDESKFGKKRKYNRGRRHRGKWVIGLLSRTSGEFVLKAVDKRNRRTLIPIIIDHVKPRSTVYTDDWKAYGNLRYLGLGYRHRVVVHARHFVNRDAVDEPVHTNTIEGRWSLVKERIKAMHGIDNRHGVNLLLHEISWKNCRHVKENPFLEILKLIANDSKDTDIGANRSMRDLNDVRRGV